MAWSIKSIFCCAGILIGESSRESVRFYPLSTASSQDSLFTKPCIRKTLQSLSGVLEKQGFRRYPLEIEKISQRLSDTANPTYCILEKIVDEVFGEQSVFYMRTLPFLKDAELRMADIDRNRQRLITAIAAHLNIVPCDKSVKTFYENILISTV